KASRKALVEKILELKDKAAGLKLPSRTELSAPAADRLSRFDEALADDLAAPRALAELWQLVRDAGIPAEQALAAALDMDSVLGLGLEAARRAEASVDAGTKAIVEGLIAERAQAKKAKDWALADTIRTRLKAMGFILEDSAAGTTWKKL
ncbi:MAG: cysteine--tRNA ligase, partial [Rectinemataceae bacterium]